MEAYLNDIWTVIRGNVPQLVVAVAVLPPLRPETMKTATTATTARAVTARPMCSPVRRLGPSN